MRPITATAAIALLSSLTVAALTGSTASAESAHANGFHVSGGDQLPGNLLHGGSVSLDKHGTEHVVAVREHAGVVSLGYYVRPKGKKWRVHHIRGGDDANLNDQVVTAISPSGARLLAVDAHCGSDSIRTGETSIRSPHGPQLAPAFSDDSYDCEDYGPRTFVGAVALPAGKAMLLFGSQTDTAAPSISIGRAGQNMGEPQALPNPSDADIHAVAITQDLSTGAVFVVGTVESVNNQVETPVAPVEWTWLGGSNWSDPVSVGVPSAVVGITADDNRQTMLLAGSRHAYVVNKLPGQSWSGPMRVPHLLKQDAAVMTTNVATKSVHLVYPSDGGIDEIVRVKRQWHKPRLIIKGGGSPNSLAVRPNGHAVVGYVQY